MKFKSYTVYDDDDFFQKYTQKRKKGNAPNETIEQPIIDELIGDVTGKTILDLGCGDGLYGKTLLDKGAKHYHGIEGSTNMFQLANKYLTEYPATIQQAAIETLNTTPNQYDLVLSRLVLHYIENLEPVLENINKGLRQGGHFVCSIEHPIITSCYDSFHQKTTKGNWLVDNYFSNGERTNEWIGKSVIKYHKTIETYFQLFQNANFEISALRESKPSFSNFDNQDQKEYERRMRIPLFMMFKLTKP